MREPLDFVPVDGQPLSSLREAAKPEPKDATAFSFAALGERIIERSLSFDEVRPFDLQGQLLDETTVRKRLADWTPVLVRWDMEFFEVGEKVPSPHPQFLEWARGLVREDVIVLSGPLPSAVAPGVKIMPAATSFPPRPLVCNTVEATADELTLSVLHLGVVYAGEGDSEVVLAKFIDINPDGTRLARLYTARCRLSLRRNWRADAKQLVAVRADGTKITETDIPALIGKHPQVLIPASDAPIHKFYLRSLKGDVLILPNFAAVKVQE